jgi:predicted nucleic acid-binding protein
LIMVDTSAWVEFLRDTGTPVCRRVDELLGAEMATWDPVRMELLAGAGNDGHLNNLRRLLGRAALVSTAPADYDRAAALYRKCRRSGQTVRRLVDCLIAAVAIRAEISVLHADTDFDVLARHTALRVDE